MPRPRPRLSIATVMMATLTAGSAAALFAQILPHLRAGSKGSDFPEDYAALFVVAVIVTGIGLAAWRKHTPFQAMLQITLACLALLSLNGVAELGAAWKTERPLLYWYQSTFVLLVVAPLVARRIIRNRTEHGAVRDWRARTCEAVAFSFLNALLVFIGVFTQALTVDLLDNVLKY